MVSFKVPSIRDRKSFLYAKGDTCCDLIEQLVVKDIGLKMFEAVLEGWIESWTVLDEFSLETLEKDEELANEVDEFVGKLMQLHAGLKNTVISRYERKIARLEKTLKKIENSSIDEI